jgi:hypothetical protein
MKVTSKKSEKHQIKQKECGKLGSQCRFIVETVATFKSHVNIKKYFLKII